MEYNTLWVDNYCDKLINERKNSKGKPFYSVYFSCDAIGGNYGTVTISKNQRFFATRRNGSRINGFSNLLLGEPDRMRKVTFKTPDGTWDSITLSVKQIVDSIEDERKEYQAKKRAVKKAKREQTSKSMVWEPY